ncbi:hypothetical protein GCM10020000_77150 [Streptomyces olivoverticillatus]
MPEVAGPALGRGDGDGPEGHGLALGDEEGVQLVLGREDAVVGDGRVREEGVLVRHVPGEVHPVGVGVGDLLEVRVDATGRGAAQEEARTATVAEHVLDRADHLQLALVVHRVARGVVEDRQRGVQPQLAQHLVAVDGLFVPRQPAVGDAAAADERLVGVVGRDAGDGQPPVPGG